MPSESIAVEAVPAVVAGLTSIVIVAADSGPLLLRCVASVLAIDALLDVVVVDNGSMDGEPSRVRSAHADDPRLQVLRSGKNLGFGPACNKGAAIARGDVVVFLNPDCTVPGTFVRALRESLDSRSDIGLLGATLCTSDGAPARGNRRRDPSLRRALASMTGVARWQSRWPALAGVEMPSPVGAPLIEAVDAVSGACMAMRRSMFEQLHGFDEDYFLHCEDLDLCRRVRDSGFKVAIANQLHVVHEGGSSSRHRAVFVARHKHRGMWRYFCKFDPAAQNPLARSFVRVGLWSHFWLVWPRLAWRQWRST